MADYKLDTGKFYVKDIFAADKFYNVPEYQRSYVWEKDNIVTMLEDIEKSFKNNDKKEYFLGCMIWNSKEVQEDDMSYRFNDILDGQQRFITLYILQAVLRDLSTDNELKNKVNDRMKQKRDVYDEIPERNRIVFSIREDSDFVEDYIIEPGGTLSKELNSIILDKKQDMSVRNMANAILTMHDWWSDLRNKLSNPSAFQKYVSNFYTYLSSKVLVLYLSTSNNLDDAYNLFTVLNSRGMQLRSSDIIKAQNLRSITNDKTRKKYAKRWDEYNNFIEMPFNSFDDFLWNIVFIIMKYRSEANKSLSKAFDFIHERKHLKPGEDTFDFIGRYAEHVEKLAQDDIQFEKYGYSFYNINYIMNTTMGNSYMMVLMYYYDKFREVNLLDFMIKVDNLVSVSWLLENRNLETRIFIILRKIEEICSKHKDILEASTLVINDDVLKYEYEDVNTSSTKLDINTFFDLLEKQDWGGFSGSRINKTRYILLKLDLLIGNHNTKLLFNKNNSSLEHIMPQKPNKDKWKIDADDHANWLHKLGNVILIDRRKNSSLSNSTFDVKKEKYSNFLENRANTNYVFIRYNEWDIENIKNNHNRQVAMLKKYYLGNSVNTLDELRKSK